MIKQNKIQSSDGTGSIFFDLGQVSHLWFRSGFLIFSPSGQKNLFIFGQKVPGSKMGRPLISCGSKASLGQIGSGQGPSLIQSMIRILVASKGNQDFFWLFLIGKWCKIKSSLLLLLVEISTIFSFGSKL